MNYFIFSVFFQFCFVIIFGTILLQLVCIFSLGTMDGNDEMMNFYSTKTNWYLNIFFFLLSFYLRLHVMNYDSKVHCMGLIHSFKRSIRGQTCHVWIAIVLAAVILDYSQMCQIGKCAAVSQGRMVLHQFTYYVLQLIHQQLVNEKILRNYYEMRTTQISCRIVYFRCVCMTHIMVTITTYMTHKIST